MYVTRKGTEVRNERAIKAVIHVHEYNSSRDLESAEFFAYSTVRAHDDSIFAESGDSLYVKQDEDREELVYVTNLTSGDSRTMSWDALSHAVKPAEEKNCGVVFADPQDNGCRCTLMNGHMGSHRGIVFAEALVKDIGRGVRCSA